MKMKIYNHTQEAILSEKFIKSCKDKIKTGLKSLVNDQNKSLTDNSNKFQFNELILSQKDLERVDLILDNKNVLIIKDNFNFFTQISEKLKLSHFSNFLSLIDFESLETSYELLSTLESFFMTICDEDNFETAVNLFSSIVTEVGMNTFTNLIYSLCYTSTKDEIIKTIFNYIEKVSLSIQLIHLFNSDQEQIALEYGQYYLYDQKPEFNFLSFFIYIPMNKRIKAEMKSRNLEYLKYREDLQMYELLYKGDIVPTEDPICKAILDDDVETMQNIMSNNMEFYLNLTMKLCDEILFFNHKMCLTDFAAYFGSLKCFKNLILNHATQSRNLPYFAILGQNCEIIRICDQNNLFVDETINKYSLEAAFYIHNVELFQWLAENKITFDLSYFQKLFARCVKTSNYQILDFIYQLCNDNNENVLTNRSLYAICDMNNSILFDWYFEKVGNIPDQTLQWCFCSASQIGNINFLNRIFNLGLKKYNSYKNISPLHYAIINGDIEIIEKTLNLNRKILNDDCRIEAWLSLTPLMLAFKLKRYDIAKFLLSQKDINLNAKGSKTYSFLTMDVYHYVSFIGDYEAFSMLMKKKIFSKLDLRRTCIAYIDNKGMCECNYEDIISASENEKISKLAKKFH